MGQTNNNLIFVQCIFKTLTGIDNDLPSTGKMTTGITQAAVSLITDFGARTEPSFINKILGHKVYHRIITKILGHKVRHCLLIKFWGTK